MTQLANPASLGSGPLAPPSVRLSTGILGIPSLPRFIAPRPRLTATIERALGCRLVILRGPSGAGKTMGVSDWARACDRAGLWVSLRPGMHPDDLWAEAARAIAESPLAPDMSSAGRVEAARYLDVRAGTLVVDNLDDVAGAADEILWLLLNTSSTNVIVISQRRSTLEAPQVFARHDACPLFVQEFPFTVAETSAALAQRGLSFDEAAPAAVHDAFSGWPAAVGLAGAYLAMSEARVWHADDVADALAVVERDIADAVLGPLRRRDDWTLIQELSALPYLTETNLSAFLIDGSAGARMIDDLEQAGLGYRRRIACDEQFVFVEHVQQRLRQSLASRNGEHRHAALRRAAEWCERSGETLEAIRLTHQLGDWAAFSRLTLQFYPTLTVKHTDELTALLDQVPAAHRAGSPWLLLLHALILTTHSEPQHDLAQTMLTSAEAAARALIAHEATAHAAGLDVLHLNAIRMIAHRRRGSFSRAAELCERVSSQAIAAAKGGTAIAGIHLPEILSQAAKLAFELGRYETATERFQASCRCASADERLRIESTGYLALIATLEGGQTKAREWLSSLVDGRAWRRWKHTVWGVPAQLALALLAIDSLDRDSAHRRLGAIERLRLTLELDLIIAYAKARLALLGDDGYDGFEAVKRIERSARFAIASNHQQGLIAGVRADLLLAIKQARSAAEVLRPFLDGRESVMGPYARTLLFTGNEHQLIVFHERCARRESLTPRVRMELGIAKAIAAERLGDHESAQRSIAAAQRVGESNSLLLPWAMVPSGELVGLLGADHPVVATILAGTGFALNADLTVPSLTKRETLVLQHLQTAAALKSIAQALSVSPHTVKSQARSVYRKLGVSSRSEAVRVGLEWRII